MVEVLRVEAGADTPGVSCQMSSYPLDGPGLAPDPNVSSDLHHKLLPKKDLQCLCGMATIISDDGLEKQSLFCFAASLTCTKSCEGLGIPNGCQLLHRFNQTVQLVLQAGCHA